MEQPDVVVITGASAGVGRASVRAFAGKRAKIALLARGQQGLEAAAKEVINLGGEALVLPTDVADAKAVESAASQTEERFGPITIWINNAMTSVLSEFTDLTPEEFKRVTEVTYLGYVYGTMAALKRMVPRNHGTIIQVGSSVAYRSIPLQSAYSGAKHAIRGFTDSVRTELMHRNSKIHLTSVHLPAINTPQFTWCKNKMPHMWQPVPPIYQPEVAAQAILWVAYNHRREVILGATSVLAVWADKLMPGVVDRYLSKTGYSSQQFDGASVPTAQDNLFKPVEGDVGARGIFNEQSAAGSRHIPFIRSPVYPWIGGVVVVGILKWLIMRMFRSYRNDRCVLSERDLRSGRFRYPGK